MTIRPNSLDKLGQLLQRDMQSLFRTMMKDPAVAESGLRPRYDDTAQILSSVYMGLDYVWSKYGSQAVPENLSFCSAINGYPLVFAYIRQIGSSIEDCVYISHLFVAAHASMLRESTTRLVPIPLQGASLAVTAGDNATLSAVQAGFSRLKVSQGFRPSDLDTALLEEISDACHVFGILLYPLGKNLVLDGSRSLH